jgi:hypothetical protein
MKRSLPLCLASLLAVTLGALPGWAQSGTPPPPDVTNIQVTYHGGPLLQSVRVVTLFWGPDWKGSALANYFNGFFKTVFADGRFMANLAQYDTDAYTIGDGTLAHSATDVVGPPATVQDADIRAEIRAQIAARHLPQPDANTLYFVFTPPHVDVVDSYGDDSVNTFTGYHDFVPGSDGFAYAVIPYTDGLSDPRVMTVFASHELAEAVTDPEPGDNTLGWYDDSNGEIGDIPVSLFEANQIGQSDLIDELDGSNGAVYLVQKEWSLKDNGPVAFAVAGSS